MDNKVNMIVSAEKWSKSSMIVGCLKWRMSRMVFGFGDNFSGTICPALVLVPPEGVNLLTKGIKGHKNRKRSGNTMNESSAICLTYSSHRGSFISMEKWNLTLKDALKCQCSHRNVAPGKKEKSNKMCICTDKSRWPLLQLHKRGDRISTARILFDRY